MGLGYEGRIHGRDAENRPAPGWLPVGGVGPTRIAVRTTWHTPGALAGKADTARAGGGGHGLACACQPW
jgi:hypothetical protein